MSMVSVTETGHAKNVANFNALIIHCQTFGDKYNPAREGITLQGLTELYLQATNALKEVNASKATLDVSANKRAVVFNELRPVSTKVFNILAASGADDLLKADARTIIRKIYGKRAGEPLPSAGTAVPIEAAPPETATEKQAKNISVSQQSYDSLVEHFSKLVELVSAIPGYAANEDTLSTAGLQQHLASITALNTEVLTNYSTWSAARANRDNLFYSPVSGLVHTAQAAKAYIKGIFGPRSKEYKQAASISFMNLAGK